MANDDRLPEALRNELVRASRAAPSDGSRARIIRGVQQRTGGGGGGGGPAAGRVAWVAAIGAVLAGALAVTLSLARLPAASVPEPAAPPSIAPAAPVAIAPPPPSSATPDPVAALSSEAPSDEDEVVSPRAPADVPSEISLVDAALGARIDRPRRALALVAQHERLYPHGMLTEEREAIAIEALARLGSRDAALARLARFEAAYPSSPHRARLDELLATP